MDEPAELPTVVPIGDWLIIPARPRDVAGVIMLALPGAVWAIERPQLALDSPSLGWPGDEDSLAYLPIVARLTWRVPRVGRTDPDARLFEVRSDAPTIAWLLLQAIATSPAPALTRMRVVVAEPLLARFPEVGSLGAGLLETVAKTYGLPAAPWVPPDAIDEPNAIEHAATAPGVVCIVCGKTAAQTPEGRLYGSGALRTCLEHRATHNDEVNALSRRRKALKERARHRDLDAIANPDDPLDSSMQERLEQNAALGGGGDPLGGGSTRLGVPAEGKRGSGRPRGRTSQLTPLGVTEAVWNELRGSGLPIPTRADWIDELNRRGIGGIVWNEDQLDDHLKSKRRRMPDVRGGPLIPR